MKIFRILAIAVGVVGLILWILLLGSTDPYTDVMLHLGKGLVYITAATVLFFTIKNLVAHPEKLKKALVTLVVFAVIVAIGYAMADGNTEGATESTSKWVGAGLYTFYILTVLAILAMAWTGLKKLIGK